MSDIDEFKVYTRRDSATAVLKKLGVAPRDYNMFIEKLPGDQHRLKLRAATEHVEGVVPATSPVAPATAAKAQKEKGEEAAAKSKSVSVSAFMQQLILEGLTNEEVWKRAKPLYKLNDNKKHYPAWYRSHLRRNGKLRK
jgi:hypothetical protein